MPPSNHRRRASPQPVQSWPIQDDNSCGPGCKRDIPPPPTRHQSSVFCWNFGHFNSTGKLMDFGFPLWDIPISPWWQIYWLNWTFTSEMSGSHHCPSPRTILSEVWDRAPWGVVLLLQFPASFPCVATRPETSKKSRLPTRTNNCKQWNRNTLPSYKCSRFGITCICRCNKLIDLNMSCVHLSQVWHISRGHKSLDSTFRDPSRVEGRG